MEKWSGRIIPLASSVIGAGLNYYFVRAWGERARSHFRKRHMEIREPDGRREADRRVRSPESIAVLSRLEASFFASFAVSFASFAVKRFTGKELHRKGRKGRRKVRKEPP